MISDCQIYKLKVLLDLHYSDTWADPGHQQAPYVWKDLSYSQSLKELFKYTSNTFYTDKELPNYPVSFQGQTDLVCDLIEEVASANNKKALVFVIGEENLFLTLIQTRKHLGLIKRYSHMKV